MVPFFEVIIRFDRECKVWEFPIVPIIHISFVGSVRNADLLLKILLKVKNKEAAFNYSTETA